MTVTFISFLLLQVLSNGGHAVSVNDIQILVNGSVLDVSYISMDAVFPIKSLDVLKRTVPKEMSFEIHWLNDRRCVHWKLISPNYRHDLLCTLVDSSFVDVNTLLLSLNEWTVQEWKVLLNLVANLYLPSLRCLVLYCIFL